MMNLCSLNAMSKQRAEGARGQRGDRLALRLHPDDDRVRGEGEHDQVQGEGLHHGLEEPAAAPEGARVHHRILGQMSREGRMRHLYLSMFYKIRHQVVEKVL